jgi:translation initiation factor 3 subunit A
MAACKRTELAVRVDHVGNSIVFLDEPFASASTSASASVAQATSTASTANLQPPTADLVRTQLTRLASILHSTVQFIDPSIAQTARDSQRALFALALAQAETEQRASAARRAIVARRNELSEELSVRRATEEAAAKAERQKQAAEAAKKREEEDFKRRQREKIQSEIDQVRIDEARKLAESLKQKGGLKVDSDVRSTFPLPFSHSLLPHS